MLIKAKIIDQSCYQVLKDEKGNAICNKISINEYMQLGVFNATPIEGFAYLKPVLDTPSGDVEDGYYWENPNGTLTVKLSGCSMVSIKSTDIVNGNLDSKMEETIRASFQNEKDSIKMQEQLSMEMRELELTAIPNSVSFKEIL